MTTASLQFLAVQDTSHAGSFGTMEIVFLVLWALFGALYFSAYKRDENVVSSYLKVGCLLGFVYGFIVLFDWMQAKVPAEEVITFGGLFTAPEGLSPRIPFMGAAFTYFVVAILTLVVWYARRKITTVGGVVLSAWDRGHWYMLPVIFILMTVGLLLVAAAASPVLSPFIYTLF